MKKLRLNLDEISVEGFAVLPLDSSHAGSILGREDVAVFAVTNNDANTCVRASCPTGHPCQHICP